jgi:hypothetical protein
VPSGRQDQAGEAAGDAVLRATADALRFEAPTLCTQACISVNDLLIAGTGNLFPLAKQIFKAHPLRLLACITR